MTTNNIGRFLAQTSNYIIDLNNKVTMLDENVSGIVDIITPIDAKFSDNYNTFTCNTISGSNLYVNGKQITNSGNVDISNNTKNALLSVDGISNTLYANSGLIYDTSNNSLNISGGIYISGTGPSISFNFTDINGGMIIDTTNVYNLQPTAGIIISTSGDNQTPLFTYNIAKNTSFSIDQYGTIFSTISGDNDMLSMYNNAKNTNFRVGSNATIFSTVSGDNNMLEIYNDAKNTNFMIRPDATIRSNISGSDYNMLYMNNSANNTNFRVGSDATIYSTTDVSGDNNMLFLNNIANDTEFKVRSDATIYSITDVSGDNNMLSLENSANNTRFMVSSDATIRSNISGDNNMLYMNNRAKNTRFFVGSDATIISNISGDNNMLEMYNDANNGRLIVNSSGNIFTSGTITGDLIIPTTTDINDISSATSRYNILNIPGQCVFYINSGTLYIKTTISNGGNPYSWIGISGTSIINPT